MALPMGLCPDTKRRLNVFSFKKNQTPTMLDKGRISSYSTDSGCSPHVDTKSKYQAYYSHPGSFHSRTKLMTPCESFLVGGFLGSKSQARSANNQQCMWDFITQCVEVAFECIKCDFASAPSPAKKKFVDPVSFSFIDSMQFPSVLDELPLQDKAVEGPKQSYAEVAKATTLKAVRPDTSSVSLDIKETGTRRGGTNRRKAQSANPKRSRRRLIRQDNRVNNQCKTSESVSSSVAVPLPDWKDLRLNQQEKHFSQLKAASSSRNSKRQDSLSNIHPISDRRDRLQIERNLVNHSRSTKRPNYRSHCDNKRGTKGRNFNCDIDKINWRTGEPIYINMGSQSNCEDYPADHSFSDSLTTEQRVDDCAGGQRELEFSISDATSWPEAKVASPKCRRRSLSSECSVDSEDSFIIFQTGEPSECSLSDAESDYSDCDSDDSYDSDSASSDEDDTFDALSPYSQRLKEVNELWQREYSIRVDPPPTETSFIQKTDGEKKVHFTHSKPIVHQMVAWDFAYRSARPGPWEEMVRDRERFKSRIRQCEAILSPILLQDHRKKILKRVNEQN